MAAEPLPTSPSLLLDYLHSMPTADQQHTLTIYSRALAYIKDDRASLQIFLEYVEIAVPSTDIEDMEHIYSLMKVKLRAFREYWDSYIDFEVNVRKKSHSTSVQKSLEYLRVKVFPGKEQLVRELEATLENSVDKTNFTGTNNASLPNTAINTPKDTTNLSPHGSKCLQYTTTDRTPEGIFEIDIIQTQHTLSEAGKRLQTDANAEKLGKPQDVENNCNSAIRDPAGSQSVISTCNSAGDEKEHLFECSMFEDTMQFNKKSIPIIQFKNKELFKISRIGKGGYSEVYRVFMDGDIYALKQMRVVDREGMRACRGEILLLEKLRNHDFVIKMLDYEVLDGNVNILLEYGEIDLQKMISSEQMNIFMIKYIWESILRILVFIHGNRIVHRDIKPANFVLARGRLKLIDFGISKSIRADTTSIINTEKAGTLNYISPEQCTGKRVGRASDMWSAGCILYNMIYRKNVHSSKNVMDVVRFMSEEQQIVFDEADNLAIESMKMCLVYDPKKRAKPEELLAHPFLSKR